MIGVGLGELVALLLLGLLLAVTVLLAALARRTGSGQLAELRAENQRLSDLVADLDRRLDDRGPQGAATDQRGDVRRDPHGPAGPGTDGAATATDSTAGGAGRPPGAGHADDRGYLITHLGEDDPERDPAPPTTGGRIDGRLFADLVLRETVVKAASLAHGVRRALDPETRNRIRFRMRQQTKQARKDRRAEAREALREYRARRAEGAAAGDGDAA